MASVLHAPNASTFGRVRDLACVPTYGLQLSRANRTLQGKSGQLNLKSRNQIQKRANPLVVRAIEVSGPGAVDSTLMSSMQDKIKEQLQAETVSVTDVNGDGRHVSIEVVSSMFEGKRSVDRQRLVYRAIWEELQGAVHAVDSLTTKSPSEL